MEDLHGVGLRRERAVRASVRVATPGRGVVVPVDLSKLILQVHVFPAATRVFEAAVRQLCSGLIHGLSFQVRKSRLMAAPHSSTLIMGLARPHTLAAQRQTPLAASFDAASIVE